MIMPSSLRSSVSLLVLLALLTLSSSSSYVSHALTPRNPTLSIRGGASKDLRGGSSAVHQGSRRNNKVVLRQSDAAVQWNANQELAELRQKEEQFLEQVAQVEATAADNETKPKPWLFTMDGIVFISYLCNVMALSLPVLLVPVAAEQAVAATSTSAQHASVLIASQVAKISSVASLGGAIGKFVNGFICKELGSHVCSKWYLAGLSLCSLLFSLTTSPTTMGLTYAGMEFFASIQWAALAVMLTNYYQGKPAAQLAAALTAMGLSSSGGQVLAKTLGMTLSTTFHWRSVARFGAVVAAFGSWAISRAPTRNTTPTLKREPFQWSSVTASLKAILGSGLFWMLAVAHAMAFVARGTDRILGTFFHEVAALPQSICGGLTLSITLGLIHGLVTGSKQFNGLDVKGQRAFLTKRYVASVAATLGLMGLSKFGAALFPGNKLFLAAAVALVSSTMASNIAFQYFQFPVMIAQKFGEHKAVCISFLDGFGFLLSVPIFATIGSLVPAKGWPAGWALLATLFGSAATLMMASINPILNLNSAKDEKAEA